MRPSRSTIWPQSGDGIGSGLPRRHAEAFAAYCTAALTLGLRRSSLLEIQSQLTEAMASRSIIDQTLGILMAQQRCSAEVAFDLLRQVSQRRNRRLRDVAADIVADVSGGPPQPGGFRTGDGTRRRRPR